MVVELESFFPGFVVVVVDVVLELVDDPSVGGLVGSLTPDDGAVAPRGISALAGPATTRTLSPAIAAQSENRRIRVPNFRPRKSVPNFVASLNQMPRRVANAKISRSLPRHEREQRPVHLVFSGRSAGFDHPHPLLRRTGLLT